MLKTDEKLVLWSNGCHCQKVGTEECCAIDRSDCSVEGIRALMTFPLAAYVLCI